MRYKADASTTRYQLAVTATRWQGTIVPRRGEFVDNVGRDPYQEGHEEHEHHSPAREGAMKKKTPAKQTARRAVKRGAKDLPATRTVRGGTENVVFTSVSNVLKTRHDTAKNSISNVR